MSGPIAAGQRLRAFGTGGEREGAWREEIREELFLNLRFSDL
jgi:hypothetical protein